MEDYIDYIVFLLLVAVVIAGLWSLFEMIEREERIVNTEVVEAEVLDTMLITHSPRKGFVETKLLARLEIKTFRIDLDTNDFYVMTGEKVKIKIVERANGRKEYTIDSHSYK